MLASWGDRILQLVGMLKRSWKTADGDPLLHHNLLKGVEVKYFKIWKKTPPNFKINSVYLLAVFV